MSSINWRVGELPAALADFDDNTFHAGLLDGPYGLSEDPPFDLVMRWLNSERVKHKAGFLGREWDELPPGPAFWREMNRVLRPGALVFSFAHSRTPGLAEMAIRAGGFRILPAFAWLHAESQALGADVSKLIDKAVGAEREVIGDCAKNGFFRGSNLTTSDGTDHEGRMNITAPATPLAQLFHGHNSRLRTNHEPILCAMKPLDGTYSENAARWGCAGFNAAAGRIPTVSAEDDQRLASEHASAAGTDRAGGVELQSGVRVEVRTNGYSPEGRFPSSVLIEHAFDCEVGACVPGCPAAVLAEQGGDRGLSSGGQGGNSGTLTGGKRSGPTNVIPVGFGDSGDCTRFYFQARPGRKERSAGCEGLFWQRAPDHPDGWRIVTEDEPHAFEKDGVTPLGNPHPALKSLELTRYLARLLRQPGEARIIIPFCGSGSEAIGAILAGWRHVTAIDGSEQWIRTGKLREAFWRAKMESGEKEPVKRMLRLDDRQRSLFG